MDAHLFSRFCEELAPRIIGGWLEKVQEPAPGLLAFNINLAARGQSYGQAGGSRKCQLCLRAARKEPFLFLSRSRLAAGRAPSAPVMRLRKYLAGHRILATVCCFSRRRLWLLVGGEAAAEEALHRQMVLWSPAEGEDDGLSPESGAQPDMADMTPESGEAAEREPLATWLLLDLREGASVRFLPVSRSPQEESLRWPEPGELEEALAHWRDWPVLTPALRRALPLYDELDRQALLEDLRLGGGDVFYYTPPDGEVEEKAGSERPSCRIAAWPLPDALAQGWHEEQGEDILGLVEKGGRSWYWKRPHATPPVPRPCPCRAVCASWNSCWPSWTRKSSACWACAPLVRTACCCKPGCGAGLRISAHRSWCCRRRKATGTRRARP